MTPARAQALGRAQQVVERDVERDVEREAVDRRADPPQPEHRAPGLADPHEGGVSLGQVERERKADDIAVEGDRPRHVAHGEVRLEEPADGTGSATGSSMTGAVLGTGVSSRHADLDRGQSR